MRNRSTRRLGMDLMMMLFLAMGAVLYLILPLINIPEKKEADRETPPPQGNLMVELYWPDNINTDVDLWVMSEADGIPVGYSNKGGPLFNLLRDDLGTTYDISGRNMEIAYSRGLPDGEYIVNAHLFSLKSAKLPIPIRIVVAMKKDDDAPYQQLFTVTGELLFVGHEKTMARFSFKKGEYQADSFHTINKSIRSRRKGATP